MPDERLRARPIPAMVFGTSYLALPRSVMLALREVAEAAEDHFEGANGDSARRVSAALTHYYAERKRHGL